jgi:hypothetical protein
MALHVQAVALRLFLAFPPLLLLALIPTVATSQPVHLLLNLHLPPLAQQSHNAALFRALEPQYLHLVVSVESVKQPLLLAPLAHVLVECARNAP